MPEADGGSPDSASPILEAVCARCLDELPVDHATVALASGDGLWTPAYATSAASAELDLKAFALGEGPCYDALDRRTPVLVADLLDGSGLHRWPFWVGAATAAGMRAVSALPIQAGAMTAGVLTLLSNRAGALSPAHLARALVLADTALLGLLDLLAGLDPAVRDDMPVAAARDGVRADDLPALVRAEVHQAAGMIMVQAGVPIDQALARLRARAFQTDRSVRDVAFDVVARRISFGPQAEAAE